jgi:cytoskeletal protein RodZ
VFPLTELGKRLKEAREERNMSLDDLQEITKIQKRYLIGIEEGNYAIMPGKFYVRAFIKQYAEAVGLDPEELFEQYPNDIPSAQEEELPGQLSRVKSRQLSEKGAKLIDLLPKLLVATVIIGVAVALWIFFQNRSVNEAPQNEVIEKTTEFERSKNIVEQPDRSKESKETEEKQQDDQQNESKEEEKDESKQEEKLNLQVVETSGWKSTMELSGSEKFILEISTKGDSWVEVKNAKGKSFFHNMMHEDESQTFDLTNEEEVLLVIGYTPNTEIKINDEVVQYPIDPNSEVRQDIKIIYKKE